MFQVGDEVLWTTPNLSAKGRVVHISKFWFWETVMIQTENGTIVEFDGKGRRGKTQTLIKKRHYTKLELALK